MENLDKRLQNKWWRLTHLYKIKDKQGQIITFKPNYLQLKHLAERGSHRYNLILKYRQGGVTTLYEIDELDEALWVPGMSCGIIAHEAKKLPEYFNIIKLAFKYLPDELKPKTKTDTKMMYEFTHRFDGAPLDSSIYVATDVRGGTVQRLHITESAYIKDRSMLKSGSKQAVPLTGFISEETTGNGFNEFYDDYMEARENPNSGEFDYRAYFYSWVENREYSLPGAISKEEYTKDELEVVKVAKEQFNIDITDGQILWRRWKIRELRQKNIGTGLTGIQLFKQEYPLTVVEAFQSGAGAVFDLNRIENTQPVDPLPLLKIIELLGPNEEKIAKVKTLDLLNVKFWKMPDPLKHYIVGIDPSDGQGSDNSCIDVWCLEDLDQVAQFYGKVRPDELAEIAAEVGRFYSGIDPRGAFIGVENNMLTTILMLSKIYDNYYFETKMDEKTLKRTKKLGWSTNIKTRDIMIDEFNIYFDEGELTIRSTITLREMRVFVKNPETGKREAAKGKHDDSLFAAFIAVQMRKFYRQRARVFATKPF